MNLISKSPLRVLVFVASAIFIAEIVTMVILHFLRPFQSEWIENVLDSVFLLTMLSPVLYGYLFRPLLLHIGERKKAEDALKEANDILELKIKGRTEELLAANKQLQHELVERHQAEQALRESQALVLQQEKMASIGQLSAGIAHEINNPIGFIASNLGSLKKYADKMRSFIQIQAEAIKGLMVSPASNADLIMNSVTEQKHSLKVDAVLEDIDNLFNESFEGTERVKKIVQDLKIFSHTDSNELRMADINAGIESTLNIVWNELKYKVTVNKELSAIPLTKCNPGQLNQVIMNLLVNAVHAIEKQGAISIKTWCDGEWIHISISDTGCGIPNENLNKIFDPFFTTKEVGKGTGLGLSITYDIVKKHNGKINVQSEVGKGTTFIIKLPLTRACKIFCVNSLQRVG